MTGLQLHKADNHVHLLKCERLPQQDEVNKYQKWRILEKVFVLQWKMRLIDNPPTKDQKGFWNQPPIKNQKGFMEPHHLSSVLAAIHPLRLIINYELCIS